MKKGTSAVFFALTAALLLMFTCGIASAEAVEEAFKRAFPDFSFEEIKPTNMSGIYEVRKGTDVIYFLPEYGYLFFGEIITSDRKNLTAERKDALAAENAKKLPLDKAVTFGKGKHVVIEFTDPDCPYCRRASTFLKNRSDITRHIFFLPLPMHPDAGNKAKYVICSEDRSRAYEEAMSGKLDDRKYEACTKQEADDVLNTHVAAARSLGVTGTPFFIIDGKTFVRGADLQSLEKALSQ